VPADLDAQICSYLSLSPDHRAKFERAIFWLDVSSRQFTMSVSAAFAALVSAIETLTERGDPHYFDCPVCGKQTQHEVRGATRRFKDLIDTYAPGVGTGRRSEMYQLRSGVLHGSKLVSPRRLIVEWSGAARSRLSSRRRDAISPSVWRSAKRKTARSVSAVVIANAE
jgi:hypothetical protein